MGAKKPYKERLSKLMKKIELRIGDKTEKTLSFKEIDLMFPAYGKAISRLSKIKAVKDEYLQGTEIEREPRMAIPMSLRQHAFKFTRAGGGYLVRKRIKLAK